MKHPGTTSVEHSPGEQAVEAGTDWAAVDALTDEEIAAAVLNDADSAPLPVHATPGVVAIIDVKRLREGLRLTQEEFASAYRIPVGTLRDWEQRRKVPDAPARAYLTVIARDPSAVAALLTSAA